MRHAAMPNDPGHPRKCTPGVTSVSTIFEPAAGFTDETLRTFGLPLFWPYHSLEAAVEVFLNSSDAVYRGQNVRTAMASP